MTRADIAKNYFESGYACSQAVAMAFQKDVGVDLETLQKLSLPFGGGLGRLRLTCGAVSGMAIVYGLFTEAKNSPENKMKVYEGTRELCARFEKEYGSLTCAELLKAGKKPCAEIVYSAAKILETYLKEKGFINE